MNWAVAVIEPNRDFEAERVLKRAGFRVVFLCYRKILTGHARKGWAKAGDIIPRPLFPGYLFVELRPDQAWPQQHKGGFLGFILRQAKPVMLAGDVVECWRSRVNAGEFDDKQPETAMAKAARFMPANSAEERRQLLAARFAELIGEFAA